MRKIWSGVWGLLAIGALAAILGGPRGRDAGRDGHHPGSDRFQRPASAADRDVHCERASWLHFGDAGRSARLVQPLRGAARGRSDVHVRRGWQLHRSPRAPPLDG